jgi:outer membrane usher protein
VARERHARASRVAAALLLALIGAAPGGVARGQQGAAARGVGTQVEAAATAEVPLGEAPVQLVVNGVPREVVIAKFEPNDVWLPLAALEDAGLKNLRGERQDVAGAVAVSLRSLAPAISHVLDERTLELHVDASAELLGRVALDARGVSRPENLLTGGHTSAFANYAVQGNDQRQLSLFAELGAGAGSWLATTGISRTALGQVVRGLSAVTREEPDARRRWTAGDAVASAGPLGGTLVLGGISVERDFNLDPWFVRQPMPRTSAVALTPSTLEVYVNGRLVRRDTVAPGTIELANLPVEAGAGSVRTVLRDAFGRTQEVASTYYFSGGLLSPGVSEYGFHAGVRRDALGAESFGYGDAVALGRWRQGITDAFTAGARLEAGRGLLSGGPVLTVALPVGELELAAAASAGEGEAGAAGSAGWSRVSRRGSLGLRATATSAAYANASLAPAQDRATLQLAGYGSLAAADRATLGLEGAASRMRDGGEAVSLALRGTIGFGRGVSLLATAGWARETSGASGPIAMLLFTHSLRAAGTASVTADRGVDGRGQGGVGLQRPLPAGSGFGYRLDGRTGDTGTLSSAVLQAQGEYGRVEAAYERSGGRDAGWATASGGVVWMDGGVYLTRAVQDGYALVQVPGVEGVRVQLNGSEVGRTNGRGHLLVPGLLPYNANRVAIRSADVPIDYALDEVERLVAPPRRIGARVRFDVQKIQTITGTLSVLEPRGEVTPAYGELWLQGVREPSPLASDGRFYLSSISAGRHEAEVEYAGGRCTFVLVVPEPAGPVTDVGSVRCVGAAAAAAPVEPGTSAGAPSASTVIQATSGAGGAG